MTTSRKRLAARGETEQRRRNRRRRGLADEQAGGFEAIETLDEQIRAGADSGSFYHFFDSKDAVRLALERRDSRQPLRTR